MYLCAEIKVDGMEGSDAMNEDQAELLQNSINQMPDFLLTKGGRSSDKWREREREVSMTWESD